MGKSHLRRFKLEPKYAHKRSEGTRRVIHHPASRMIREKIVEIRERQAVLVGEGSALRGIVLHIEGKTFVIMDPAGARRTVLASDCRLMPLSMCFMCGEDNGETEEQIQESIRKSDVVMTRDFGAPPPPERRMCLCSDCAKKVYEWDKDETKCICAFSRGEAPECTCAARRARGFQRP